MLTIDQVIKADVVDRVGCPTCDQRRYITLDCHCCGGRGYVDCDSVFDVVAESLGDCCFINNRLAPSWLPVGFYAVLGGAYVVLPNRQVDFVTDEQAEIAYRVAESRKRPSVISQLFSWLLRI